VSKGEVKEISSEGRAKGELKKDRRLSALLSPQVHCHLLRFEKTLEKDLWGREGGVGIENRKRRPCLNRRFYDLRQLP
jgi:hypothetical protein